MTGRQGKSMTAQVGGVTLQIPVFEDLIRTQSIVHRVNERIREIETSSTRIDSQAFALQAAVSFAMELESLRNEMDHESREIMSALGTVLASLRKIIKEASGPERE